MVPSLWRVRQARRYSDTRSPSPTIDRSHSSLNSVAVRAVDRYPDAGGVPTLESCRGASTDVLCDALTHPRRSASARSFGGLQETQGV
jgi:hypothetical protein